MMSLHLPSWLLVVLALFLILLLMGCTRGEFEVVRADGTSARGQFTRLWTDTTVSASPEAGFSYSSNPDAAQQQQMIDILRGALQLRAAPLVAPPPPVVPQVAPLPSPPRPSVAVPRRVEPLPEPEAEPMPPLPPGFGFTPPKADPASMPVRLEMIEASEPPLVMSPPRESPLQQRLREIAAQMAAI